ncbi:MAG: molecular chaperone HtpG, partial [bacterium]|nr:molecular chaperone HtpG [bacterium]
TVIKIKNLLVKRILDHLSTMAEKDEKKYREFWNQFGRILKEGYTDYPNLEKIVSLFRFNSSKTENADALVSLDDYINRMRPAQENIYYISATSREAADRNPHLEIYMQKGIEVLYSFDPIDEFVLSGVAQYKEKKLLSADQADLESLNKIEPEKQDGQSDRTESEKDAPDSLELGKLCTRLKNILGTQVEEVRISQRLTESPAVLVTAEGGISAQMSRIMQVVNKDAPPSKKIMEINGKHPLIRNMLKTFQRNPKDPYLEKTTDILFQVLMLQDGFLLDPHKMVDQVQSLLSDASNWYLKETTI